MATEILFRGVIAPGYVNHLGSTSDKAGNVFWAITQDRHLIIKKRQRGTGVMEVLHTFNDTVYGYCTLECVGAHLVLGLSRRNELGETEAQEYLITNVCEV